MRLLSEAAEYALRAIVWLAEQPAGTPQSVQEIAEKTRSARGYLAKVMQDLGRARFVRSQRGLRGGFVLTRPTAEIRVLDVINAVDPIQRIETCPLGLEAHGKRLCPLHRRIDNATALVEQTFADTTIADILAEPSKSKPLCSRA